MAQFIENKKLDALIDTFGKNNSILNLIELVEELRNSFILMPGKINENKQVAAAIMNLQNGKKFIPIFTKEEYLKKHMPDKTTGAVVKFGQVCDIAQKENDARGLDGIVINPSSSNIILNMNLITKVNEAEKKSADGVKAALELDGAPPKLNNSLLEDQMLNFGNETDPVKRNQLLNLILSVLRTSRLVFPLGENSSGRLAPMIVTLNDTKEKFFPVYTDAVFAAKRHSESRFSVVDFNKAVSIAIDMQNEVEGMSIVSEKSTINLKLPLLEKVKEINEKLAKKEQEDKEIKEASEMLVPEQIRFSMKTLPELLFADKEKFVEALLERKAAFIDEVYENSYYNVRMYPYVEEEFGVMAITAREKVDIIQVEFPKSNQGMGCAVRAYITWDGYKKQGRYFGMVKNEDDAMLIMEVLEDGQINHGMVNIETNEMSAILELLDKNGR